MSFVRRVVFVVACVGLVGLSVNPVSAGGTGTPGTGASGTQGTPAVGAAGRVQHKDSALATCLMIDGFKQIEICQYALGKVQNAKVKAFAEAEIKEHQDMKMKLQQKGFKPLIPMAEGSTSSSATGTTPSVVASGETPATGTAAGQGRTIVGSGQQQGGQQGMEMLQIKHEIAQQCISNTRKEFEKKQASELDMAFVGQQMAAHMHLLDTVQVFRRHASGELRSLLEEAQPVIENHLAMLQQIKEELKSQRSGSSTSNDR